MKDITSILGNTTSKLVFEKTATHHMLKFNLVYNVI